MGFLAPVSDDTGDIFVSENIASIVGRCTVPMKTNSNTRSFCLKDANLNVRSRIDSFFRGPEEFPVYCA